MIYVRHPCDPFISGTIWDVFSFITCSSKHQGAASRRENSVEPVHSSCCFRAARTTTDWGCAEGYSLQMHSRSTAISATVYEECWNIFNTFTLLLQLPHSPDMMKRSAVCIPEVRGGTLLRVRRPLSKLTLSNCVDDRSTLPELL